jgi:hypothetical protein
VGSCDDVCEISVPVKTTILGQWIGFPDYRGVSYMIVIKIH